MKGGVTVKEMICITCPKGCHLKIDEQTLAVTGNGCPRGAEYAKNELTNPLRTVTSTVRIEGSFLERCPVKTSSPVPKPLMAEVVAALKGVTLRAPVHVGDVVLENVLGTGSNVVVCREMPTVEMPEAPAKMPEATCTLTVTEDLTALRMGSGSLPVFATPALAALMEKAACAALEGLLEEGKTSVGTALSLSHTAATPVGMKVSCHAVLTGKEGRTLTFEIVASDEKGEIGRATHTRAIVSSDKFLNKTYAKLEK